jgi:hypothetical protein
MACVIADAGPLVAYLDRSASDHDWVRRRFMELTSPLLTCQAVVTETVFLLKRDGLNPDWVLDLEPIRITPVARVMRATGPSPRRSDRAYRDEIRMGATTKGAGRCRHHPLGGGQKAAPPRCSSVTYILYICSLLAPRGAAF